MRGVGFERQVAELVDDPQLRLGVEAEPLLEPSVGVSLDQAGDQRRRGDEQHRVALADRLAAERDGEVGLAAAWWAAQEERRPVGYPAAGRQIADLDR